MLVWCHTRAIVRSFILQFPKPFGLHLPWCNIVHHLPSSVGRRLVAWLKYIYDASLGSLADTRVGVWVNHLVAFRNAWGLDEHIFLFGHSGFLAPHIRFPRESKYREFPFSSVVLNLPAPMGWVVWIQSTGTPAQPHMWLDPPCQTRLQSDSKCQHNLRHKGHIIWPTGFPTSPVIWQDGHGN